MQPAIVVVGYNRNKELKRLLTCLNSANYPSQDVNLIISLDDSLNNLVTAEVAEEFQWSHGYKEVIKHNVQMGLRQHILLCGDLSLKYSSIILLEDDLFLSPSFYLDSIKLIEAYDNNQEVAQISLYTPELNEFRHNSSFVPYTNNHDTYLMQVGVSWGQIWTKYMWNDFRKWLSENPDFDNTVNLPGAVCNWPVTSWKKRFNEYLVRQDKYVLYPVKSLSTNLGSDGSNHTMKYNHYNVPIHQDAFKFLENTTELIRYDQHMELILSSVPEMRGHELAEAEMDIYGTKDPKFYPDCYFISSRKSSNVVKTFGGVLKFPFQNVIQKMKGDDLVVCLSKDLKPAKKFDESIIEHLFTYKVTYLLMAMLKKVLYKFGKS